MKSKKTNDAILALTFTIGSDVKTFQFYPEHLRNWIDGLRITPDQQTVKLAFNFDGTQYSQDIDVATELATIKKAVKYAELLTSIIPKSLNEYLTDITQKFSQEEYPSIIGREHEIEKAWFYLSQKRRNNVFLIGDKDVGKTAIANEIVRRISLNDCPKELYTKRVIMLNPELLLKIKSDYLYEHKIDQLVNFLKQNKESIILYVDKAIYMKVDIQLIYILYACLKEHNIPLIVTSSEDNFDDYFYNDESISKYINYISVEEPDFDETEEMVRPYIETLEEQYGIKISDKIIKYAIFTSELSPSISVNPGKVINIFERAFLNAKRKNLDEVDKKCILSCYDARIKEYSKMPEAEKRSTAYHEAGHYILAVKSKHRKNIKISCVSNLPMNWWNGVTMSYYDIGEYAVTSKDYFLDYIAMSLAGRIAEKKFTGLNSTGASADLKQANDIAKSMIMEWGFSDVAPNLNRQYDLLDYYLMPEDKKKAIDDEIQELINEGTKRATDIIEENEELLKVIAEKLFVEEILTGEELEAICKEYEK